MNNSTLFTGTLGGILIIFLFITAALWFFLPFAVFGIKGRIDRALGLAETANRRLEAIENALKNETPPDA
ncbi:MAG: hypothetical protein JWM78_1643 [Verrucomicrobiaceae bacterium]|nr:hypothetical protein [Verrucomicrobiaceae bacterium]